MRLLADLHISPKTVQFLRELGHDIIRVGEALPPTASDQIIHLDFSHLIALSGSTTPSLITLRLSSARIEYVNAILQRTLPDLEEDIQKAPW